MRVSLSRPWGDGEISQKVSSSSLTPKLLTADPKKTGATSPDKQLLRSKASYTPSIMSSSSRNSMAGASPMIWSSAGSEVSAMETTSSAILVLLAENKFRLCWQMLQTPWKRSPIPIGQVSGRTLMDNLASNSSSKSKASLPSRSILLIKMMTGVLRMRHTSMRRSVWASTPLAQSMTKMTLSTAVRVRKVSSAKSL